VSEEAKDTPAEDASGRPRRADGRPETPPTPFDHPLFLPALLFAGMLWFGYDGFINQDPEMHEHQEFNRYGFVALTLATIWYGYKGLKEFRADREADAARSSGSSSSPDHDSTR